MIINTNHAASLPTPQQAGDGQLLIPDEICAAAEMICEYFQRHNIKTFSVAGIQNRIYQ